MPSVDERFMSEDARRQRDAEWGNRRHLADLDGRRFDGPHPVPAVNPFAKTWLRRQTLRQREALARAGGR